MANRPFKSLFEARDALTAEILAGKLELSATQSAVLRVLTENTLYTPTHPEDYGFVVTTLPDPLGGDRIPLGVETIARLTGYKERATKTALGDLQDMKLIRRFKRPNWYGGRSVDRIRLDWAMPEGASDAPSEGHSAPVYGAPDAPSARGSGAPDAPSIGEEGSREEVTNKGGVTTQTQSQTRNPGQASRLPGFSEILASFRGYYEPKRVRPLAGKRLMTSRPAPDGLLIDVWHNPRLGVVYAGSHTDPAKYPGPAWEARIMWRSDWNDIKGLDVITLID